jgi:hypothetical protein
VFDGDGLLLGTSARAAPGDGLAVAGLAKRPVNAARITRRGDGQSLQRAAFQGSVDLFKGNRLVQGVDQGQTVHGCGMGSG